MVEAELMEDGGVDVLNQQRVFSNAVAKFISGSKCGAPFEATTGQKDRVSVDVMIATNVFVNPWRMWSSSHFTSPDDNRFIEQSTLLQIFDQTGDRLIRDHGIFVVVVDELPVLIPGGIVDMGKGTGNFNEANTLLD